MRVAVLYFLAVLAAALGGSAGARSPLFAQEQTQHQTTITVEPPQQVRVGDTLQVVVHLTTADGAPIDNQPVFVSAGTILGGEEPTEARATTDASGQAVVRLRLTVGKKTFLATYPGSTTRGLAPSQSLPGTVEILPLVAPALRFDPLPIISLGARARVVLHAEDDAGEPIAGINAQITLDGQRIGTILTDDQGAGDIALKPDLKSGTYTIAASYDGSPSRKIAPASTALRVDVGVAWLQIHTVPPLPGMRFQLTDLTSLAQPLRVSAFTSDAQGLAFVPVFSPGAYALSAAADPHLAATGRRASFARWSDDSFASSRLMYITSGRELTAGFDVDYRVKHEFIDLAQQSVAQARVTSVTLTNSLGEATTLTDDKPVWLHGSRVVRRATGLEESRILYSVKSVIMDKSNVVNEYEQRFYPEQDILLPITVSLYSMHISTRDALFGFSVGSAVKLQYPDGRTDRMPFGSNKDLSLSSLPRGPYKVKIVGYGVSSSPSVALSRNQEVEVRVISYLDIAVVGFFAVVVVFGLLVVGRWRWLNRRRNRPIPLGLGALERGGIR